MSVKHAQAKPDEGPITRGKGLDTLDRFIIQNWAAPTRFGVWRKAFGALAPLKTKLEPFFDQALKNGWMLDGHGAVITIDPPADPFVTVRVEYENKVWTPESKYNPKHWLWKVVPQGKALGELQGAAESALPEVETSYLQSLREGKLKGEWEAVPEALS